MKLKILLLFIVGFITLAGAVPLETPEEDAKLEPAVEDLDKEDAEEVPAPEQSDSEQEDDANEADEAQEPSDEEQADENDENEKEDEPESVNDEEEPESDVTENEQDAKKKGGRRPRRPRCINRRGVFVCYIRRVRCKSPKRRGPKKPCYKKHCRRHRYRSRVCLRCKNHCGHCRRVRLPCPRRLRRCRPRFSPCHWYAKHVCHGRLYARVCFLKHVHVCPRSCKCHRVCLYKPVKRRSHRG